jgi:transcriptional regulator with XRE-family HTH domain
MSDRAANGAFGMRVRVALAAARVDRTHLAKECRVTPQAVQRWCDGTSIPSSANLMTLCRLTGCSAEWLMWPHPVDIRSTEWAINGTHIKNIVRATLAEIEEGKKDE